MTALAVLLVAGAAAVPRLGAERDILRAAGAARHLAGRVQWTRAESVKRGTHVALQFLPDGSDYRYGVFADGNRNGVRAADISRGIDPQVAPWERLADHFAGVSFGIVPGVTDVESGGLVSGSPLRLGGSSLLSFGPSGGASSGTIYLRGRREQQFAVRVLGATGRSRLLRFDFTTKRWAAP
jgi:hypothetical protein